MRRTVVLIAAVGVGLLLVFGGVAFAKTFTCKADKACVGTNKADEITGTNEADKIKAKGGNDTIDARGGEDKVNAGAGEDEVSGGENNDTINLADGEVDVVDCGPGDDDTLIYDGGVDLAAPGTAPTANCENFDPRGV
jgi:Ca2+-binding RTX toxin-like protein